MSLFNGPAEHASNRPETWVVARVGRQWALQTAGGTTLGRAETRGAAESLRTEGFIANLYAKETRWYAGEPVPGWQPYRERPKVDTGKPA